ncbi:tryptophan synthase, alpha subunit [Anaeromyxobacter sp. K]|uniref:tryptophan synthase subunit alpha n=1 Tax=Anaeromyxobacter sp. (strain K) TaxID=447217 RepID=UPI00015F9266|nr:tryptophan synthase subunit alpha [Anaeromyxobacter sp. K]ACG75377.1 tryptophan synthase, alpha subunit [Anaeromyxobacter sp. K]
MSPRPARKPRAAAAPAAAERPDRISAAFERCRAERRAALVTYVMGGDPDLATARQMALACVEGGADLVELGVPFSDPIADGPTIQAAAQRALGAGTTLEDVLGIAAAVRARSQVPIALMGYLNPMLAGGVEKLVRGCADAGVDALIIPDLLPEEAEVLAPAAEAAGVKLVYLLAPTSNAARVEAAARAATGFLYFVSVTGVTGARHAVAEEIAPLVSAVRARTELPVVIGFGVASPEQARALGPLADGVVVGSAIVQRIAEGGSRRARAERVTRFVRSLGRALRR